MYIDFEIIHVLQLATEKANVRSTSAVLQTVSVILDIST